MSHLILEPLLIGKVKKYITLALGLLDYAFLIKNPMDLGTVGTKLKDGRYQNVEEVFDDIQLVWDNCKTYNPPNSVTLL